MHPLTKKAEVSVACSQSVGFLLHHPSSLIVFPCHHAISYGSVMDLVNQAEFTNLTISNSAKAKVTCVQKYSYSQLHCIIRNYGYYNTFGGALLVLHALMQECQSSLETWPLMEVPLHYITDGSLVIKGRAVMFLIIWHYSEELCTFSHDNSGIKGKFHKQHNQIIMGVVQYISSNSDSEWCFLQNSALYGGAVKIFHSKVVILPGEGSTGLSQITLLSLWVVPNSAFLIYKTMHAWLSIELNTAGLGGGALYLLLALLDSLLSFSCSDAGLM